MKMSELEEGEKEEGGLRVGGEAMTLGGVERMRWRARERKRERLSEDMASLGRVAWLNT